MASRNPLIEEALEKFVVSNDIKGSRRVVMVNFRNLANALGRDLQDSGQLMECLNLLVVARARAEAAALDPRPVPDTAVTKARGRIMTGGASAPEVSADES